MTVDRRLADMIAAEGRAMDVALRAEEAALKTGGGDGTSGGVIYDWNAGVDTQLKYLREDMQQIRNWIIVGIAGQPLAIIGLNVYTGTKFDALATRMSAIELQQVKLDDTLDRLLECLPAPPK